MSLSGDVRAGVATARVRRWFSTWGILVGYCTLIFVLSSQPDLTVPELVPSADKLAHFLEYGGGMVMDTCGQGRPTGVDSSDCALVNTDLCRGLWFE